ncbi:hypothetical protein [Enterococcus faecium]
MSRGVLILAVVLVVILGGLTALGLRSGARPLAHVEKAVSVADLKK